MHIYVHVVAAFLCWPSSNAWMSIPHCSMCVQGSCGYGMMDKSKYPYWSVAALSRSNSFYVAGPIGACGQCFEIQCVNSGGQFAVRCSYV